MSSQQIIQGLRDMESAIAQGCAGDHLANHQCPSSTSVLCCSGSSFVCRPRPKKALFEEHFSACVSLRGVGHLAPAATVSSGDFLPKLTHTHTDVRHSRLLPQLLIVGALFSNCASLQISFLHESCGGMRSCVLQVDISCASIHFHIRRH